MVAGPTNDEVCDFLLTELDVAVFFMDSEGKITRWSPGVQHLLGYTEADFLGQHASMIFTSEDRDQRIDALEFERALKNGRASDTRWHQRKDGTLIFVDGILTALKSPEGRPRGYAKIVRSVFPDRVRQRVASTIMEGTNEAISVKDRTGRYAFVNSKMAQLFERPEEEIIGHRLEDFQPPEICGPINEDDKSVMASGNPRSIEEYLLMKGHGLRTFLSASVLNGKSVYKVGRLCRG